MSVRRVVTGHDGAGKAIFVSDTLVDAIPQPLLPGVAFHRLWGADLPPTIPNPGGPAEVASYMPPAGGFRFDVVIIPPDRPMEAAPSREEVAAILTEVDEKLPWLLPHVHVDLDNPHVHSTDTIDFDIVLSGEVSLELDDGATVHLTPGDTIILNGTRHVWHNSTSEPAMMAVALIGVQRRETADAET